jgi:adenine deaminase
MELRDIIDVAAGRKPADLVLRGGRVVNVYSCEIHEGDVAVHGSRIAGIGKYEGERVENVEGMFICPGLIDAHVHIESSMLDVPAFARLVACHGTTTVISDPHEIANVMGAEGIRYMLSASKHCPIYVYVMASSCVPASRFESAGAELGAEDLLPLLSDRWVLGLAEMMNYPGVVAGDEDCLQKIIGADGRPIDGHAPGLTGMDLCAYVASGIGSDHECTNADEAVEKLRLGMHIMIRDGSQARNLAALLPLIKENTLDRFMFCTDDKDVVDLLAEGQIDHMIREAIAFGLNPIHAVRLASLSAAKYFGLHHLGAVAPGLDASLVLVDDLERFNIRRVYQAGRLVAEDGNPVELNAVRPKSPFLRSSVNVRTLSEEDFAFKAVNPEPNRVHVIEVLENRIDTERTVESMTPRDGCLHADPARDICKITVIERHQASGKIGRGLVRGFGMTDGAFASSVGHDSHNLVIAGTNDHDMLVATLHLIDIRGGLCVVRQGKVLADVPLPIAGLMAQLPASELNIQLQQLHEATRQVAGKLRRPYMALSFLSLSVIGKLKITDQGLIDVDRFEQIPLIIS